MRLPVAFMRQVLTVTRRVPGPPDPLTGASTADSFTIIIEQPCSLQQVRRNPDGTLAPVSGVQADVPAYRCYTPFFPGPPGVLEYRVDGTPYPLARRVDVGGQGTLLELHFGAPGGEA